MKRNVFLTSIRRNPLRSLVLFLLIGAATFAFVMRTTEFFVVRGSIYEAASFYRSIGFLQAEGRPYGNVLDGANLVAASPHLAFEDRRRGAEAVMHGVQNVNIGGRIAEGSGHVLFGPEAAYITIPERLHYTYFYGTVARVTVNDGPRMGHFVELRVDVDEVVVGFPEHAAAGTRVRVRYHFSDADTTINMQEGGRYFMRAALYWVSPQMRGIRMNLPAIGAEFDFLYLHPLNDQGLMYLPVPYGSADLNAPGLEGIAADIQQQRYNHSVLWLRTTADMTAMPIMQEEFGRVRLMQGRFLTHEDYLAARPVAVIHHGLAIRRGLAIGDTITVSIPAEQEIRDLHIVATFGGQGLYGWAYRRENFVLGDGLMDFAVLGNPQGEFMVREMELEIVGTYEKLPNVLHLVGIPGTGIGSSLFGNYVYIPDSLLPADFMPVDNHHGHGNDYVWNTWYSFVLNDTRNERAFLQENRDVLAAMGYALHFIPTDADNFWASAEGILGNITFNAVTFWAVLVMVLGLATFLFLSQRRRDFAIMRALGCSQNRSVWRLCFAMAVLAAPAIVAGGVFGWFFALDAAAGTLDRLAVDLYGYYADYYMASMGDISMAWLALQIGAVFVILVAMAYGGTMHTAKIPLLMQLQGNTKSRKTRRRRVVVPQAKRRGGTVPPATTPAPTNLNLDDISTIPFAEHMRKSKLSAVKASFTHGLRHVLRAPVKSLLTALVALFFIATLGVLQGTINGTELEINRLYDTTVVTGRFTQAGPMGGGSEMSILAPNVNLLLQSGIVTSHYAEASFPAAFIIPPGADGNFPTGIYGDFWEEFWWYIRDNYMGDAAAITAPLLGFNCLDAFLTEHGQGVADFAPGGIDAGLVDFGELGVAGGPLEIDFGQGFGPEDFAYADPSLKTQIPVILSDLTLERRGLNLGDSAFIGHYFPHPWRRSELIEVPVTIIGSHNGSIDRTVGRNATLLPMAALEFLRGSRLVYIAFNFELDTAANRELVALRYEIQNEITRNRPTGTTAPQLLFFDEELRTVVGQMEQNLLLLQFLYPVVIILSVIIGAGLAALLMLQNAKMAAIMRVLGYTKMRARAILCTKHVAVAACGVAAGLALMPFLGADPAAQSAILAGLYVVGVVIGSIIGAIIITGRAPLALLQVRE